MTDPNDGPRNKTPSHTDPRSTIPDPQSAIRNPQSRPACPVCGGSLVEIRMKLVCSACRAICETCCEGGRG
jgi:hypothetical protein